MKLFLIALLAVGARAACPGTYTAQRTITVNSSQITGTLSNYPMLVLNPSASLKTVGNGGVVTDANGYDITFYNAGGSLLAWCSSICSGSVLNARGACLTTAAGAGQQAAALGLGDELLLVHLGEGQGGLG